MAGTGAGTGTGTGAGTGTGTSTGAGTGTGAGNGTGAGTGEKVPKMREGLSKMRAIRLRSFLCGKGGVGDVY